MKFKIKRETLLKPLQFVIGVVERRQTLPVLSNVLSVSMSSAVPQVPVLPDVWEAGVSQPENKTAITAVAKKINVLEKVIMVFPPFVHLH